MELDSPHCTHRTLGRDEYCCLNCDVHFDLNLNEVSTDIGFTGGSSTGSATERAGSSTRGSSTQAQRRHPPSAQTPPSESSPSLNFPPAQIALAEHLLAKLKSYKDFTKIENHIAPIVQSLQEYLSQALQKA